MKKNYAKIVVVLDRSGSMESVKNATIEGFNKFLQGQKEVEGECDISLYQFDDKYEAVFEDKNIQEAPKLTDKTFVPRGWTALLDAIGRTINKLGNDLHALREKDRPEKVFFVIQTDGYENDSKEFTREKIFDMIKHQTEKYSWKFIFLGANQDAIATAQSYGIGSNTSLTYSATSIGTDRAYYSMNSVVSGARCAAFDDFKAYSFSQEDRDLQKNN